MKIVLQDLTKTFPGRSKKEPSEVVAVDHFNFEIPDGKLIGLLGPSGCGKSTTLNLLCGLLSPTDGSILFGDEDVTALPQYISANAVVKNAFITQGCVVEGEVKNSVLFTGAKVGAGAKVIDSVLMPGAVVEEGAVVTRALVANGVQIGKQAVVGSADSEHIELVAKRVKGAE